MESDNDWWNKYVESCINEHRKNKQYLFLVPSGLVYDHDRDIYKCNLPDSINTTLQAQLANQTGIKKMLNENAEKISKEITNARSGGSSKANILSSLNSFVVNQVDPNLLRITTEDKAEIHSYILKVAELFNVSSERKKR